MLRQLMYFKKRTMVSETTLNDAVATAKSYWNIWGEYKYGISDSECNSYSHFDAQSGGGRQKKTRAVLNKGINPMDLGTSKTPPQDLNVHDITPSNDDFSDNVMMAETSDNHRD